MKRHPGLIPLFSHDHRQGLLLAQVLKPGVPRYPGMPTTASARRDYVLALHDMLLTPHFRLEEEILAPLVRGRDPEIDTLLDALLAEHQHIDALIDGLQHLATMHEEDEEAPAESESLEAHLHELGNLLEQHIRREERQLFQRIQIVIDDAILQDLKQRLEDAHPVVCLPALSR